MCRTKTITLSAAITKALARQSKVLGVSEAQLIEEAFGDLLAMDGPDPILGLMKRRSQVMDRWKIRRGLLSPTTLSIFPEDVLKAPFTREGFPETYTDSFIDEDDENEVDRADNGEANQATVRDRQKP